MYRFVGSDALEKLPARRALASPAVSGLPDTETLDWIAEITRNEQPRTVELVHVGALRTDWSPRAGGLDPAHVRRLTEAELVLPPIYVHRETMQIIDGRHRAAAAIAKGSGTIAAYLIEGSVESIFVIAVNANVMHGLPLSLADRKAAAVKVLDYYPDWSSRAIADTTGLSAKTVNQLRRATAEDPQLHTRLGRDGRRHPLSTAAGRSTAAELLVARPNASLRQIAKIAGISPGTVRDVRQRLSRGEEPIPKRTRQNGELFNVGANIAPTGGEGPIGPPLEGDVSALVTSLARDPALRMNENGRKLLRWLFLHTVDVVDGSNLVGLAPEHSLQRLIDFAHHCSLNWAIIAERIRRQIDTP